MLVDKISLVKAWFKWLYETVPPLIYAFSHRRPYLTSDLVFFSQVEVRHSSDYRIDLI